MKDVRKTVKLVQFQKIDGVKEINFWSPGTAERTDHNFKNKISEANVRLRKYCEIKDFLFIRNENTDEGDLNESGLYLNRNGSKLFTRDMKNILKSLIKCKACKFNVSNYFFNIKVKAVKSVLSLSFKIYEITPSPLS